MRSVAQRQRGGFDQLARHGIGQRDLGCRDQPPAVCCLVAVLAKLGKLASAEHRFGAHQNRAVDFGQAVFFGMGVEHELRQCAVDTRHGPFEHDKPRTRQLGSGCKIHGWRDRRQIKMLFRGKIHLRGCAPPVDFDIVVFVRTLRRVRGGQVRNSGQHRAKFFVKFLGLGLHRGHFGFLVRNQCAQTLEFGLVAAAFGGTDVLGCAVLLGLRRFGGKDACAAGLVHSQQFGRDRRIAPTRQGRVKCFGVAADRANIVHGKAPRFLSRSTCLMPQGAAGG